LLAGCALAASSGLLLTLSFSPFDVWWLVWLAFVPMVVAEYRVLPPAWSALAPAIAVGGFTLGYVGGVFPARAAWYMKLLPLLIAAIVFVAAQRGRTRRDRAGYASLPLAAAITWVAFELARAPALGTWGFLGLALYRQPWLLQPVREVGTFGLDLLIVLVNYAVALAVLAALDRLGAFAAPVRVAPRLAGRWCAGVALALGLWIGVGLLARGGHDPIVRVAVLQPGVRRGEGAGTRAERERAMLDRLMAQTRAAAARGARLVVWPETALGADPAIAYTRELGDLARATDATLVVGYGLFTPSGLRNEVVTVDPSGAFVGRYGKNHPVTFLGETSVWRGRYPTVEAPFGRMGSIICYDMDFTDTARELARRGVQVIAVPSADWPAIAAKHYTLAVLRALETGAVVAKSEFNRDSVIVDGYGRIAARTVTPSGSQAILVADVPLRAGTPLAARLGDWVGWLCVAALAARAVVLMGRRRSSSRVTDKIKKPATKAAPPSSPVSSID
jgi:apolipoprotein N-acyltransferase